MITRKILQLTIRFTEARYAFLLFAVVLRLALEFGYWVYVNPIHPHEGFSWNPNALKYFESWVLYLLLVITAPKKVRKPSDYFLVFLLFGLMGPLFSFYALADKSREHLYIVLLGYFLVATFRHGRPLLLPTVREGPWISIAIATLGAMLVTGWFVASGGVAFFNLDLKSVYAFRREAEAVIHAGVMGYVTSWAYTVFGPALLAVALWKRMYWMAGLITALYVFWFGVSALKSVLFYPFLVVFLWFWFRKTESLSIIPLAMVGVVISVTVLFLLFDYYYPASLFVRRTFYVPAFNTFDYYEFFSENQLVWWSNSITSRFIEYPYHLSPADLLGDARGTGAHVNNTFLSTGYMHAGVTGIVIYGVLCGLLFRLIDSVSIRGVPVWVALAVLIGPIRLLLLEADLPTSLLTHGVGAGIVILFLLRSARYVDLRPPDIHSRGTHRLYAGKGSLFIKARPVKRFMR